MRLRTFHWLALAGVSLLIAAACSAPAPAPPASKEPPFRKTATIKDIMDSMVDPSADYLWSRWPRLSRRQALRSAGRGPTTTGEGSPRRDYPRRSDQSADHGRPAGGQAGREVREPRYRSEPRGDPDGHGQRPTATLVKLADALHDAGLKALAAIDAKNAEALSDAGEVIDNACENCHLRILGIRRTPRGRARGGQREKKK